MHSFKATPLSRGDIREAAYELRKELGLAHRLWFPVLEFVEHALPQLDKNYTFEVVEFEELGSSHGLTTRDGDDVAIKIREDIYYRAYEDEGRDRGTVAHEAGHYLMHARSPALHRHFGGELKSYEDPEWQAKCFQGELLVPKHLVNGMSAIDVARQCGVSLDAAVYQLGLYAKGK
ncbi:ImmA/IrrE family metallo-endopeptidase [Cupriavidus taiwanensis]|uniref:Zinc-dependent metallopeptidase n=1 Tax=Cupriavidus taiwanensis (strain DSM 17343 / BCRC 17206 / CCUG 44338 / CIP 107171 / LMG 19424 / R1) TaxID=977880 RepID=B3R3M1_CUPTR|nr:ImmA/IrrE family metallo-endopeptidase [Cupriavidus taiwanensis]CAQ68904.1 putative Zinc-dependent metallopeptidase [Cupriavidus taiwanensis LMG 19424]